MRVPWGVSESGFAALDAALDYQYQSFGVPGLGLKRGLSRDLVIAPYATALALLVRPHAARDNFRALAADRGEGAFGFYEAIDYTRDRLREKRRSAVVRSYMSHHQGMTLLALADCLLDRRMVQRFHAEPMVRATELLLQERVPRVAPVVDLHEDEVGPTPIVREGVLPRSRRITTPATPHPRTHLLSNGQYSVMLTNAGSGYSTLGATSTSLRPSREDRTTDARAASGLYIRDLRERHGSGKPLAIRPSAVRRTCTWPFSRPTRPSSVAATPASRATSKSPFPPSTPPKPRMSTSASARGQHDPA